MRVDLRAIRSRIGERDRIPAELVENSRALLDGEVTEALHFPKHRATVVDDPAWQLGEVARHAVILSTAVEGGQRRGGHESAAVDRQPT